MHTTIKIITSRLPVIRETQCNNKNSGFTQNPKNTQHLKHTFSDNF